MKHITLLFLILCCTAAAQAQTDHCDKFSALLDKAKTLWAQKKFEDAFAKLSAAREACPGKAAEVDNQYALFIRDIANKYETADVKTREAKREAERAKNATDLAEKNATRSDSIARRAYADDLAYKSTIALRDGDRTAAFRLAEFAHRYVDDDNLNVTNALVQAIYYNEDARHTFLPWASNLEGHKSAVISVAYSPDGKKLATGSYDNSAKIWDMESGKDILTLQGHSSFVWSVAFSPDGKKLATGSYDNSAKIWDIESGKDIGTFQGHSSYVSSVAFSPACPDDPRGGKYLATGSYDNSAKIWDVESGKDILTLQGHSSEVISVAFSPDGKKLATGSYDKSAKIWDLESGKDILTLQGHNSYVLSVAFSPDGKKLATGSSDNSAKIWDMESGKDIFTLQGHRSSVRSVAFSPDGKKLATGAEDKSAKIWDIESGKGILTLQGHSSFVYSVAFSPACPDDPSGGKKLATGSFDNSTKIWDLESGKDILTLQGHSSSVWSVAFSPACPDDPSGGKKLATGSDDNSAKIWDVESGKDIATLQGHTSSVRSVAFSPDGKKLATGSDDNSVKIWDLASGKDILTLEGHRSAVWSVAFSPACPDDPSGGKKLATGSDDNSVKIWDLESGKDILTLRGHTSYIGSVAFSPDGKKLATGSEDNSAKIWDLESGKSIGTLQGHSSYVRSVVFSPDGKKLATGSYDNSAKIWDLESGKDILTLQGHTAAVRSVAFSPDGKNLATGAEDNSAKIWDLESGKDILTLQGHSSAVWSVAFSPDGKKLATGAEDNSAKIWELTPEGWMLGAGRGRSLAGLIFPQLSAYNLSGLLNIRPENEEILRQSNAPWQIAAFAELSAQNTRNSLDLRRTAPDFGRAARLYGYAFDNSKDSAVLVKLGDLYLRWAEDILASNRPDTASRYIDLACSLYADKYQCPKLWNLYAQKTDKSFQFDRFLVSEERADELKDYGDYFFETEKWTEAQQLYEKAERKQHSTAVLQNLYLISEKTGNSFDFNRFMNAENNLEILNYARFFFDKEQWQEARQLYEKSAHKRTSVIVLKKLFEISEKTGESFDFQRFMTLENPSDLDSCAIFFIQKAEVLEKFKDRIPYYQHALQLREKQIKLDSPTALRVAMANEYNNIGFYHLFLPDGKSAEFNIRRAIELDPANKFTYTNLAPALLLQGKTKEAEAEYKKWAPLPFNEGNLASYRDAFLEDLKLMEEQGVQVFDYTQVRAWLEEKH